MGAALRSNPNYWRALDLISEEKNPTSSTTQADVKGQLGGLKIGHSMVPPNSMVYHRSPHFSTKPTGDFGPGRLTPGRMIDLDHHPLDMCMYSIRIQIDRWIDGWTDR